MIRIRTSLLNSIVLHHRASVLDPTYALGLWSRTPTGSTFWTGDPNTSRIEIGWRWAKLHDAIVILEPTLIQTNLLLLGPSGREEPRLRALLHIVDYVETLPWRDPVRRLLIASRH